MAASRNVALIGCGDLVRKASEVAIQHLKDSGYRVIAVDYKQEPVGLAPAQPDRFFNCSNESDYSEFLQIAENEKFEAIYVANPGDAHLTSTLELQHFTKQIVISKPVDTHVNVLCSIRRREETDFKYLLPKVAVHDHYLNKPGVDFLVHRLMPRLHAEYGFLDYVLMFLVEKIPIEQDQRHRLESLNCGMLFDLGVHLASILDALLRHGATWTSRDGRLERSDRSIKVVACETGRFGGSFLGQSTVEPSRRAETFGVVELEVEETVTLDRGVQTKQRIPVLLVVGKGVPIDQQTDRDLKAIFLKFQSGAQVVLDIDTHRFRGVDEGVLENLGYHQLDLRQKGINKALITAAQSQFDFSETSPFQKWGPASRSVLMLFEAILKTERPVGYEDGVLCRDLTTRLLLQNPFFGRWVLPERLQELVIGAPPKGAVS